MLPVLQPFVVHVLVARIHDEEVAAGLHPVGDEVVDDPAVLVRQQRVLRAADLGLVEIVREQGLQQVVRLRALDLDLAHVRDVEDAPVLTHRPVLGDHTLVLHGHLPAGERNHSGAERDMALVERRAEQGLHTSRMLMKG